MAITLDDFDKVWASTSPLTPYEFSENNYKEGWNFIGGTPPSRQMWDFLQKNNDEKMQYLANNYLPLAGGTMTGAISHDGNFIKSVSDDSYVALYGSNVMGEGAGLILHGKNNNNGTFSLNAYDGINAKTLLGKTDGTLKWNDMDLGNVLSYAPTRVSLTNQAIASGSYVEIPIITATIKGTYYFTNTIYYNFPGTGNCRSFFIVRNSGVDCYHAMTRMANLGNILSASFIATLNVGDSVRFHIENNTNASWTTNADDTVNHLDYTLLRALQ